MELNWFYKYALHILIPQNTESGEPELKNVGEKFQDNNERWNQINDMIQGLVPLFQHS